ncbi:MAG TPA: D-Ala-D-Ala carboxypeptidase family metallohydrolase [Gemmatimonadales bacterium]|nr:D-Ala-D-Ala carboxypeptidase family metallohydrolase [Gemmatimonadales bacterium]
MFSSFSYIALALGTAGAVTPTPRTASTGAFAVRYRSLVSRGPVSALTVLPGETVTLETIDPGAPSGSEARSAAGSLTRLGDGRWTWTAPNVPGFYPIHVVASDQRDSVTIQAFVLVPYDQMKGEYINGYRIGRYPSRALHGLAIYRPPAGFVEVTRENEDALVSPHFRLKQFLCKQPGGYPKYVVLNEQLLQKLEYLLELANTSGYTASTFYVMSGFRTPAYNRSLGNVPYSRHTWGSAADIFIDENHDGRMDDLNGDGRSDIRDAEVLYRLFDAATDEPELHGLIGGMGKYRPTAAHGPFVHIDVRDRKARW